MYKIKTLLILILSGVAFGELPRLTIEHDDQRQDLRVSEVEVTVRVEGDFVDTRMSINFFNETARNQEGEFRLPLPEGASVNHYALEVNGAMREASVVEKDQARTAYETIKARNIDPGLVEKMEGNVYRTRIFPVLPQKYKRVSIGYVQPLEKKGDEMVYRLPFGVKDKILKFQLKIEGDLSGIHLEMTDGVQLQKEEYGFSYSSHNLPIEGDLVLKKGSENYDFSGEISEVNGEYFAYIKGSIQSQLTDKKPRDPKIITVIWDASAKGYDRDIKAEINFLGEIVKELGDVTVQFVVVRNDSEELGEFQVKGGEWKRLREFVEGILYDGAADFRELDIGKIKGERIIVFTSGESTYPISRFDIDRNFYLVQSLAGKTESLFARTAKITGGDVIDLPNLGLKDALHKVMNPLPNLVEVKGSVESSFADNHGGQIRIFAKMNSMEDDEVVISLRNGLESLKPVTVKLEKAKAGNAVRYLWSQQKLLEMTTQNTLPGHKEKTEIIAHCQKYGLVSDFTSLIVLERMEDHVQFRIPPPEQELLLEYEKALKEHERSRSYYNASNHLEDAWSRRARWHNTKFPWAEVVLLPRYKRVKQWTDAQTAVFEKEQLEQTNLAEFMTWKKEAEQVMREGDKITSKDKFLDWNSRIEKLLDAGNELGKKDASLPDTGEFGVSVRGWVKNPQTLVVKNGVTLRESIKLAGGLHHNGFESLIALYRSGKRNIYNLQSDEYQDIKLLPGDMIVAMADHRYDEVDPFAAAGDPFADRNPALKAEMRNKEPALVEADVPLTMPSVGNSLEGPLMLGMPGGGGGNAIGIPLLKGEVQQPKLHASCEELVNEISKAGDFWAAYKKRRLEMGKDIQCFIKVAEELYKRKETDKARQVISNLFGKTGFHVPSMRAAAYWMMQFNDYDGALEIFEMIGQKFPDDDLLVLDVMRLHRIAEGKISDFYLNAVLSKMTDHKFENSLVTAIPEMVMMERNRFKAKEFKIITKDLPDKRQVFAGDIRVVVCSSNSESQTYLKIKDPKGILVGGSDISMTGSRVVSGNGVSEFMVRRALPGEYHIEIYNFDRGAYQIEVFLNWGRPNETRRMYTLSGEVDQEMVDAGSVKFDFAEDK